MAISSADVIPLLQVRAILSELTDQIHLLLIYEAGKGLADRPIHFRHATHRGGHGPAVF